MEGQKFQASRCRVFKNMTKQGAESWSAASEAGQGGRTALGEVLPAPGFPCSCHILARAVQGSQAGGQGAGGEFCPFKNVTMVCTVKLF